MPYLNNYCCVLYSAVDGLFVSRDESLLVLGRPVGLHLPESGAAHAPIVVVPHGRADVVADEQVLLVVPAAEQVEHARVRPVADRLQNHVVSLLDRHETHILHRLHKRKRATVRLTRLVVQMLAQSVLVVQVVTGPELHRKAPSNQVLGETTPEERAVGEESRPALLVEVAVAEHR